jgi:hypothetical protein
MAKKAATYTTSGKRGRSLADERDFILAKNTKVPVPPGYKLDPATEMPLWEAFAKGRAATDWLPHELVMLVSAVKNIAQAEELRRDVEKEGTILKFKSQRGNAYTNPNPKFGLLMKIERHVGLQLKQLKLITLADRDHVSEQKRQKKAVHQSSKDDVGLDEISELLQLSSSNASAN